MVRWLKTIFIILLIICTASWLVKHTIVESYPIFETPAVFAYFGVLLGFAITIYTFGLSMTENMKKGINILPNNTYIEKKDMVYGIISGFIEIKENIWAIFISMLIVIASAIAKNIVNPFGWEVEAWQVPETLNLGLFILSTICMYDIMRTLFNLSEINLTLLKNNP